MFCVGLTGSIASGKSLVAQYFMHHHAKVISADAIARELTAKGKPALDLIKESFGNFLINPLGELDRAGLKKIIFADKHARYKLESILHPLIRESINRKINSSCARYCVIEIPLLTHREDYPYLDRILIVIAQQASQIKRMMERDNCSEQEARTILSSQQNDEQRLKLANDVFYNIGSKKHLACAVNYLHNSYLHFSHKRTL